MSSTPPKEKHEDSDHEHFRRPVLRRLAAAARPHARLRTIIAAGGPSGRYSRKPQQQGLTYAIQNGDVEMIEIEGETESSTGA